MDRAITKEAAQRKLWAAEIIQTDSGEEGGSDLSEEDEERQGGHDRKRRRSEARRARTVGKKPAKASGSRESGGSKLKVPDCVEQILRNVREDACVEAADMCRSLRKWVDKAQAKGLDLLKVDSYWHQRDRMQDAERKIQELEAKVDIDTQIAKEPGKVLGQLVEKYQDMVLRGLQSFEPMVQLLQQAQAELQVPPGTAAGSGAAPVVTPRAPPTSDRHRSASRSPRGGK